MNENLYIIQGTGFSIDGVVVKVIKVEGDYSLVSPPNLDGIENIMIKTKCLRPFGEDRNITYTIEVVKYLDNKRVEEDILDIPNALRNIPVSTIVEFMDKNLVPILRME